jgi:hypothetical protein
MVGPVTHAIVGYTARSSRATQSQYREDWSVSHPNTTRFVGLDVHKDTIVIAVAEPGRSEAKVLATIPHDFTSLSKALTRLGPADSLSCCYEAGPTGFGLIPSYAPPAPPAHAHPDATHQAVLELRRQHPTWGSELIRVMLAQAQPHVVWPSSQAFRRWLRAAGLAPAPAGRRPGASPTRADQPHQTWQIDASEHITLADRTEVCWLRILDEATGAGLRTEVFPPRHLVSGRSSRHSDLAEAVVPAVGPARQAESRQRAALGIAGRPAHRSGLLAGRAGRGGDRQSAAFSPVQWRGGARSSGGQAVVRAVDVCVGSRVAGAVGVDGSGAAGTLSAPAWSAASGRLSEPWSIRAGLSTRTRRDRPGISRRSGI